MLPLIITNLGTADETVEVVERKGLGHPDTICDALAETLSRNLCREYQERFGAILHHNVDKALLSGGRAAAGFGGGAVLAPIHIYLAGRAVTNVRDDSLPIEEIAVEGSRPARSLRLGETRVSMLGSMRTCEKWRNSFRISKSIRTFG